MDDASASRLIAEPLAPRHLDDLERLLGDPRVGATLGGTLSRAEIAESIAEQERHRARHGFSYCAFFDPVTRAFVGRGGLSSFVVGGRDEVEVGWAVVPERWGQGIGTAIARHSVKAAFGEHGLADVIALTLPGNVASRRVMEKAAFAYEADVMHAGMAHVLYRRWSARG
jgi:[ribosomal protein S5]-alanine N-acetyltransferase